jgi:hypothetical protein
LFFENEADTALIDEKNAYLWGDAFLVAPVLDAGVAVVDIDLPAGAWFDFWTDTRYGGSQSVTVPVTLRTIPVLVRAGSFVPMIEDIQTSRDYSSEKLTLHYYADESVSNARGQMYDDDGKSPASLEDQQFELLRFDAQHIGDAVTFTLRRDAGDYHGKPASREITMLIHHWTRPVTSVAVNEFPVPVTKRMPREGAGATVDPKRNTLTVRFSWHQPTVTLRVNGAGHATLRGKPVVYQVFTRLFGNRKTTNRPWGTIEQNGVGKFNDFSDKALQGIRELGVTHIWYTGVPQHALIGDYQHYGVGDDDPDVVKGRAGSPYAVKDYYNVNPDLAVDPARRLEEFESLIARTHAHGMQVIIDIVPNHVARGYHSTSAPTGVEDFGARDNTNVEWARDNNFYYVVGRDFRVPAWPRGYQPLGGDANPLSDGRFAESPAKWTGNGARAAQPGFDDWFETQ